MGCFTLVSNVNSGCSLMLFVLCDFIRRSFDFRLSVQDVSHEKRNSHQAGLWSIPLF